MHNCYRHGDNKGRSLISALLSDVNAECHEVVGGICTPVALDGLIEPNGTGN